MSSHSLQRCTPLVLVVLGLKLTFATNVGAACAGHQQLVGVLVGVVMDMQSLGGTFLRHRHPHAVAIGI